MLKPITHTVVFFWPMLYTQFEIVGNLPLLHVLKIRAIGFAVYYLRDSFDGEVYWVGSTSSPADRLAHHMSLQTESTKGWIKALRPEVPVLSVQCVVETQDEAERVETELIALQLRRGAPLLNRNVVGAGGIPSFGVLTQPSWIGETSTRLRRAETREEKRTRMLETRRRIRQGARMGEVYK